MIAQTAVQLHHNCATQRKHFIKPLLQADTVPCNMAVCLMPRLHLFWFHIHFVIMMGEHDLAASLKPLICEEPLHLSEEYLLPIFLADER